MPALLNAEVPVDFVRSTLEKQLKVPKFFITGGAGFIGSAFVRLVLEEVPSCQVINFDALTYAGNMDNLVGLDENRHHFVRGDIADPVTVLEALREGCDAIINFAAESHVDRSIANAAEFLRTNIIGTQVLLDCARARGCVVSFKFPLMK